MRGLAKRNQGKQTPRMVEAGVSDIDAKMRRGGKQWSGHRLPGMCVSALILAAATVGCMAPKPAMDLSLSGRLLPVVNGRIYPVSWRPVDHPPLTFERGQVVLSDQQMSRIPALANQLREEQGMLVAVGFGRDGWSPDHTRVLAEARALEVRRALLLEGLERERVQTVSVGDAAPPGWPTASVPSPSQNIGGWVLLAEMLIPLEAWLAAGGEAPLDLEQNEQ